MSRATLRQFALAPAGDPRAWIGGIVGGLLLLLLSWAIFHVSVLVQLVMVLSVAMVVMFFTRPEYSLLIFFALRAIFDLLWWIPGSILSLNMMELFTGAVTGMAIVLFILEFRRLDDHPAIPAFIPYMFALFVGGARSLEARSAAEIAARYASPLVIMFLVSLYFDTRRKRKRLFMVATAVGVIPVIVSLWHLAHGQMHTYYLAGYYRLQGGYKNLHNHALMMMFISTMAGWWLLESRQRQKRAVFAVYLAGSLLCMYLTYVRTALLSFVVFWVAYLVVNRRRRLLALGAFFVAVFVITNPAMQDRFKDIVLFFTEKNDGTVIRTKLGSGRWGLWTSSFREYLRYPIGDIVLGLGFGKHWLLTRQYFNPYNIAQQGYVDPHNDYLTMTYQVGPIASLSYIAMQIQVIRYGVRVNRLSPDRFQRLFAAYVVGLCFAAFQANSISNAFINRTTLGWYFWGLAGAMFAEWRALQREGRAGGPVRLPVAR